MALLLPAAFLLLLLLLPDAVSCADVLTYTLTLLTDAAARLGAVSLDGSPAAYYVRRGAETRKVVVHQSGGGWCSSPTSCAQRSNTTLGSTTFFPPTAAWNDSAYVDQQGYLTPDPARNPVFWNWTWVVLPYTDGSSQTGNVDAPVLVPGWPTPIYYRGARVLNATMEALIADEGLALATDVVYSGCSAGGLSVYLHLDKWAAALRAGGFNGTLAGMADSGFFLEYAAPASALTYPARMNWTFVNQNVSAALNPHCLAEHPAGEGYRCLFAQHAAPFLQTPLFMLQSYYDAYQIVAIAQVNASNVSAVTAFGAALRATINATLAGPNTNLLGGAVDACAHHCSRLLWQGMAMPGSSTEALAFARWYAGLAGGGGGQSVWEQDDTYPCEGCCTGGPAGDGRSSSGPETCARSALAAGW